MKSLKRDKIAIIVLISLVLLVTSPTLATVSNDLAYAQSHPSSVPSSQSSSVPSSQPQQPSSQSSSVPSSQPQQPSSQPSSTSASSSIEALE